MSAQETAEAPSLIAIDLGRNRATGSVVAADGSTTPLLIDGRDGLTVRCLGDNGLSSERFTDRLIELVDQDQLAAANDLVAEIASELLAAFPATTPVVIAIPAAFGPVCEAAVTTGFSRVATVETVVRRPVTSLTSCHNRSPSPVLVVHNDAGEISVVAFDSARRRVFPPAPLSVGPSESQETVANRLRAYVRDVAAHLPTSETVIDDAWVAVASNFTTIMLSGPGASHSAFRAFIADQFGPLATIAVDDVRPSDAIVQLGPLHSRWAAGWPTAVPLVEDDRLQLVNESGEPYRLRIGSQLATGIKVPADLRSGTRLRTLPDGRLLLLGAAGQRPLTMRVRWSLTSGAPTDLDVEVIGRRPLELVTATSDQQHRATVSL